MFEYLCTQNAVITNLVDGVKRPKVESYVAKTQALGDAQARTLLKIPTGDRLQQPRDRALLSVLFRRWNTLGRGVLAHGRCASIHLRISRHVGPEFHGMPVQDFTRR